MLLSNLRNDFSILSYFAGNKNIHKTFCVYALAIGLTVLITNWIKLYCGYLRPVFYDLCEPNNNYQECTNPKSKDARLSFPSGHSSLSFCGLSLLSFYLERRFGISSLRVWKVEPSTGLIVMALKSPKEGLFRIRSVVSYAPMLLAIFIASSRVHDNKHFPADVVGGSLLGGSIALLIHNIWYVDCI